MRFACATRRLILAILPGVLFCSLSLRGQSNTCITVRILDSKSGKPLKKLLVILWSSELSKDHTPPRFLTPDVVLSNATSDARGVVIFDLLDPVPERLGFSYSGPDLGVCTLGVEFSTAEILKTGVIAKGGCRGLPGVGPPKPGEIVLFGHPVPLWQLMLRELP
jgi:hypothetical protein